MDLGVGTGMLSAGTIAYEPELLIGVDIDQQALDLCARNIRKLFVEQEDSDGEDDKEEPVSKPNYDLVMADVRNAHAFTRFAGLVDTVLMNPPFGTKKNAGIDLVFLERATQIANKVVYSLHKSSTRNVSILKFLF